MFTLYIMGLGYNWHELAVGRFGDLLSEIAREDELLKGKGRNSFEIRDTLTNDTVLLHVGGVTGV